MDPAKVAEKLLRNLQSVHPPVHEYRVVHGPDFSHVSQNYYRHIEDEFFKLGFSTLGDIEDVTLAKLSKPDPRTFVRVMVDRDRTTMCGFYHIAPTWLWRLVIWSFRIPTKVVELESRATDEYWAITSTATKKAEQPRPENFAIDYATRSLTPAQLYDRHRETLAAKNRSFVRINDIEDAIQQEVKQHAMKREYLVSIGWVTPEYLAAQGMLASLIPTVYAESQRLLSEGFDASIES